MVFQFIHSEEFCKPCVSLFLLPEIEPVWVYPFKWSLSQKSMVSTMTIKYTTSNTKDLQKEKKTIIILYMFITKRILHEVKRKLGLLTAQFWRMVNISGLFPATRETRPMYQMPRNTTWKTSRHIIEETHMVRNKDRFILMSMPIDWKLGRWYTAATKIQAIYLQKQISIS